MQCEADVICLYGLDQGETFFPWLEEAPHRRLVVLQDKEIFCSFEHPRARFFFLPEGGEEEVFKQIAWEYLFLRFFYWAAPEEEPRAASLFERLKEIQGGVHLVASDWCDPEMRVVKNALANLRALPSSIRGTDLFGAFKGIPAIVCGGGPSLAKNREQLPLLGERALLFAGGSALPLVADLSVGIHFSAAIDPQPPSERFLAHSYFETPFFYQTRVDKRLLQAVHGPLLWLPDCGSSLVEREEAFMEGAFDGGWNVATFCAALATAFGCSPVVFVGLDFSADKGKIYAPGIAATPEEEVLIETQNAEGETVYSKRDWLIARKWLEEFVKKNPETVFLNATEGGLGIPGVENITLKEVKGGYLTQTWDLQGRVWAALQGALPIGQQELFEKKAAQMEESFAKIKGLCEVFLARAQEIFPAPSREDGRCVLALFEMEEEIAYQAVLAPFWEIWERLLLREGKGDPDIHKVLFFKKTLASF